jgi:8-oxo-dGTP pyrophosphatase MutT (NUDIX family)
MTRGEPVEPGSFHLSVAVWTVNSLQRILLTRRDPDKPEYPNFWECTGGSALAGEDSRTAAVRELWEETGIPAEKSELTQLGSLQEEDCFVDTYILRRDIPAEALRLQPGETVEARWVSLPQLDEMIDAGIVAPPVVGRLCLLRERFERFLEGETLEDPAGKD